MTECDFQTVLPGVLQCPRCWMVVHAKKCRGGCQADSLPDYYQCRHRTATNGKTLNYKPCPDKPCESKAQVAVYGCKVKRLCTLKRSAEADSGLVAWCKECEARQA